MVLQSVWKLHLPLGAGARGSSREGGCQRPASFPTRVSTSFCPTSFLLLTSSRQGALTSSLLSLVHLPLPRLDSRGIEIEAKLDLRTEECEAVLAGGPLGTGRRAAGVSGVSS